MTETKEFECLWVFETGCIVDSSTGDCVGIGLVSAILVVDIDPNEDILRTGIVSGTQLNGLREVSIDHGKVNRNTTNIQSI